MARLCSTKTWLQQSLLNNLVALPMFCCISQTTPREPVISKKSGHLFEKRLIVKYIKENGKCPITGEPLDVEDLLDVKTITKSVEPRKVGAVSIPQMLEMFQNEWDTLMLETFTTRKHLDTVRKELSHSLYQHDAACRVIARLVKEKEQLQNRTGSGLSPGDMSSLKDQIIQNIERCAKTLSSQRKKRKVSPSLMKPQGMSQVREKGSPYCPLPTNEHVTCIDIHPSRDPHLVICGGSEGSVAVVNTQTKKNIASIGSAHDNSITRVKFHPNKQDILLTSSEDASVKIWQSGNIETPRIHIKDTQKGGISDFSIHPTGDYLISSSLDQSWGFFDIETGYCLNIHKNQKKQRYKSISFHPDGLILVTGSHDGVVEVWETKTQKSITAVKKNHQGAICSVGHSENGYIMATGSLDGVVNIWDLRRFSTVHTFRFEEPVPSLDFDFSGVYLAVVVGKDVLVHQSKLWKLLTKVGGASDLVTGVKFGNDAKFFVSASKDTNLRMYGK